MIRFNEYIDLINIKNMMEDGLLLLEETFNPKLIQTVFSNFRHWPTLMGFQGRTGTNQETIVFLSCKSYSSINS